MALSVPSLLALAAVSTAVVYVGSRWLERSSERLATHYGLPPVVHGAIVVAVGSSFPEFSSAVLATMLHGSFDLGVAAIVGSAIFNILVIPAASTLAGGGQLDANRDLVYKEAQFYMVAVAVLLLTFSFAVIYEPVAGGSLRGVVTREMALIPLALYGLYIFVQYLETVEHEPSESGGVDAVWRHWLLLAVALVTILVSVEGLLRAAIGLGDALGTPSALWGVTVVAAGTSLPDAFVSVRAARRKDGVVSMSNVLGSNIFDLLVAVPAGVLVAGGTAVNFADAVPLMGALTFATIALFATLRTEMELTRREAELLMALYAGFVLWMALETLGVTSYVF